MPRSSSGGSSPFREIGVHRYRGSKRRLHGIRLRQNTPVRPVLVLLVILAALLWLAARLF
jgi:hypothetical protein